MRARPNRLSPFPPAPALSSGYAAARGLARACILCPVAISTPRASGEHAARKDGPQNARLSPHPPLSLPLSPQTQGGPRALCIEATGEETTPTVMYHSLVITESEFSSLRADQCLLVDFATFPSMLIDLLRLCLGGAGSGSGTTAAADGAAAPTRYACVLSIKDPSPGCPSTLSVVETNHFKQLTHISLALRAGHDAAVKRFLAARLAQTKGALARASKSVETATAEIGRLKGQVEATCACTVSSPPSSTSPPPPPPLSPQSLPLFSPPPLRAAADLTALRSSVDSREANLRVAFAAELSDARERAAAALVSSEAAARREADEAAARHASAVAELQLRLSEGQAASTRAAAAHAEVEAELRETRARLAASTADLALAQAELTRARTGLGVTDEAHMNARRELAAATTRVAVLEQKVGDQTELLARAQAQLDAATASIADLKQSAAVYKQAYEQAGEKLAISSEEINKGNGVINRLQDEFRVAKAKQKAKGEALQAAEERLRERERAFTDLQRDHDAARLALEREKHARETAEASLSSTKSHLVQARDAVAEKDQMIAWLNKELNEAGMMAGGPVYAAQGSHGAGFRTAAGATSTPSASSGPSAFAAPASSSHIPRPVPSPAPSSTPASASVSARFAAAGSAPAPGSAFSGTSTSFFAADVLGATSRSAAAGGKTMMMGGSSSSSSSSSTSFTPSAAYASNPYMAGILPIAQALATLSTSSSSGAGGAAVRGGSSSGAAPTPLKAPTSSSYFGAVNTSSGVPGGAPGGSRGL
jgi:spindle assembly abnormal protein 6